jgi:hypothetical protein
MKLVSVTSLVEHLGDTEVGLHKYSEMALRPETLIRNMSSAPKKGLQH